MKEKLLVFQGDPCTMCLDDPELQNLAQARERGIENCGLYGTPAKCSPPTFGCVKVAGLKVARYLLLFYSEASEDNLVRELEAFQKRAPMPPRGPQGYVDTEEHQHRVLTDPSLVVHRVGEYARAVLDLKPGERILRAPSDPVPMIAKPGDGMPDDDAVGAAERANAL